MSQIDDIVRAITGTEEKTSAVLRKALVLAYVLKNDSLKEWLLKELNGYDYNDELLPEYRCIKTQARGLFVGAFGSQIRNQPIAPAILRPEHRHFAEIARLIQPIAAYEDISPTGNGSIPWPADLVILYQSAFFDGDYVLNRAWIDIPGSGLSAVLDTVRTRLLTFVLEINEQAQAVDASLESLSPSTVQTLVQMIVIGGTNVFGDVQQFTAQTITTGDAKTLLGTLAALGIGKSESEDLLAEIAADSIESQVKGTLGSRTKEWIVRNAKTAGKGAVKIGVDVATAVLTEVVKRYTGISV